MSEQRPDDRPNIERDRWRDRSRFRDEDVTPQKKGANPLLILVVAIAVSVLFTIYWSSNLTNTLAAKDTDLDAKLGALTTQVGTLSSDVTSLKGLAGTVGTLATQVAQVSDKITATNQNVANLQSSISGFVKADQITSLQGIINAQNAKIDALTKGNTDLLASITLLTGNITDLSTRIKALETTTTPTTPVTPSAVIPNVAIAVSVIDEGTLQADNSTIGEIKVTLVNSGSSDIKDIVLSLFVYFDNVYTANQTIASTSYGTWSIRSKQKDTLELRGKLSSLAAGQTRRVYIDLLSWAYNTTETTYLDADTADLEVIDWSY